MMKIEAQADWKLCELVDKNYLYLNVSKTTEMCIDF